MVCPPPSDRLTVCPWSRRQTGSCRSHPGRWQSHRPTTWVSPPAATTLPGRKAPSVGRGDRWVVYFTLHENVLSLPLVLTFKLNKFHYLLLAVRAAGWWDVNWSGIDELVKQYFLNVLLLDETVHFKTENHSNVQRNVYVQNYCCLLLIYLCNLLDPLTT